MATQTTHYDMVKQQSPERVSVGLLNDNFDIIDGVMFANQEKSEQLADDYNASETYNTGDYVRRENYLYKCNTDNTTGTWDDTKWDRVKVMDEITQGGGGGSSTLAGLDDVDLSSPTDGQLLGYNATTGKWENVTGGGGGGSTTFAGLNDVNVQGVQNGDIARYNSTTGKWTDSSDLTDLELSVSQLSSSVLSIAGDVDTLELTVSQMSASTLPYDANTSIKQKIDSISTVEDIELTVNNEYFNSITYTCQKYGRLVVLTVTGVSWKKAITTGGVVVLSGLPAPSEDFNCALMVMKAGVSTSSPKRMRLLTSGNLASWYENIATDENPYGIITYLSAN